jgi:hypothetical protein
VRLNCKVHWILEPGPVAGHVNYDALFVDGQCNVTCMNSIDGVGEKTISGPKVKVTNTFSYPSTA